jgi:AcrR family transcriptional regulator
VKAETGLRELTRRAVRANIAKEAMALFIRQGFEATTLDQIAAAVGISGRSVSRYFQTKEDMVVGNLRDVGEQVAAALAGRPPSEQPWTALRLALDVAVSTIVEGDAGLAGTTMMANTPALRAAMTQKHAYWQQLLVPDISVRLGGDELAARAVVAAALSALDVAATAWTEQQGARPLGELLDAALDAIRR